MLVAWLMGANMVKDAVPVLSTHRCLKKLLGLVDCMASGSMVFTAWSTPQHSPAHCTAVRCTPLLGDDLVAQPLGIVCVNEVQMHWVTCDLTWQQDGIVLHTCTIS